MLNKKIKRIARTSVIALVLVLSGCQTNTQKELSEDITPPWIDVKQYLVETYEGKEVDLNIASAYDAQDGICDVEQSGFVDWSKAGDYFVVYSASDTSGNTRELAITVRVLPPVGDTTATTAPSVEDIKDKTCQKVEAQNHDLPCDQVLNAEAIKYNKLYYGQGGLTICEEAAQEDEVCKVVNTNDGSFWGYGLQKVEEEKEKN